MNSTIYIFGDLGNGYAQYPNDYTTEIFLQFQEHTQATTQLTIHRDENLMYYGYVRRLHKKGRYIGICIVLNGIMFRGIKTLFNHFENYITDMVVRGQIIEFSDSGDLISTVTNLYERQQEIERITTFIQNDIETLTTQKLPPLNFSIGKNESKSFLIDDKAESILEATYKYGYTYVYKDAEYNTSTLTSYSGKLQTLNKEYTAALQTIDKQKKEISDLKKKQKNYKLVIWLILIMCVGGLICFISIKNRNADIQRLNRCIEDQELTIEIQNQKLVENIETIKYKDNTIKDLQSTNQRLISSRDSLNSVNRELNKSIEDLRGEKSDLTRQLSQTKSTLKTANGEIKTLTADKDRLQTENTQLKNRKLEPEKYKVYAKRGTKAYCYYKEGYSYYKTGDSYSDYTIVYVYYKNNKYALTEKGYVLLSDLQKVY